MKVLARSLLVIGALVLMGGAAIAQDWDRFERSGDLSRSRGDWELARDYYKRAITEAGAVAPRTLWNKYNEAFRHAYLAELKARAAEAAATPSPVPALEPQAGTGEEEKPGAEGGELAAPAGATMATTSVAASPTPTAPRNALYVASDGSLRVDLQALLAEGGATRMGAVPTASPTAVTSAPLVPRPAPTPVVRRPEGPQPVSGWGQPLVDRSGGRTKFSPADKVGLDSVMSEASGRTGQTQSSTVETAEFVVSDIRFAFTGPRKLVVTGRITNRASHSFNNPKIYIRLYNETGVFRSRNWGYVKPGRNSLNAGQTKDFEVVFAGYGETVGAFKVEVVTNLAR